MIQVCPAEPLGVAPHSAENSANRKTPMISVLRWPTTSATRPPSANPLGAGRRQLQVLIEVRDRQRHDRLIDEHHRDGEDHRQQHEVLVGHGRSRIASETGVI
jgi:hypothetical protein